MDSPFRSIELPLAYLFIGLGGCLLLWVLSFLLLKILSAGRRQPESETEKDWSLPTLDSQAHGDSPFHRWDPRIKTVSLLLFMFCVASLTQLPWAALAVGFSIASVGVARIPFRLPLRRLAAMSSFLGMFVLVMPLTVPVKSGDTLVFFGNLSAFPFNVRGFLLALLICMKASAIALLAEPLLNTSPFPVTVEALARLRVPSMICQMILLTHRYIYVFQDEAARMAKGMSARGFRKRTDIETARAVGNFLGMLLVRSFERTNRVYDAMLARGYDGSKATNTEFHARRMDWILGAVWLCGGVALLGMDRILAISGFTCF